MIAGIVIGLLIVALLVSWMVVYHYHKLAKGLLLFNNQLKDQNRSLVKTCSSNYLRIYDETRKKNRLYKLLRLEHHLHIHSIKESDMLRSANEQIWHDRYHIGYKVGYEHALNRVNKTDLSKLAIGKNGFVSTNE